MLRAGVKRVVKSQIAGSAPVTNVLDLGKGLDELGKQLYIRNLAEWYHVSAAHVKLLPGGSSLLRKYQNMEELLKAAYPHHSWDHSKFLSSTRNHPQIFLERILRSLFNTYSETEEIERGEGEIEREREINRDKIRMERNARTGHGIVGAYGNPLEIDIYFPDLKLGFEYQDSYHYFHSTYGSKTLAEYQQRDLLKKHAAIQKNITLITVPFWWDWNVESLIASIKSQRPELLSHLTTKCLPILQTPPDDVVEKYSYDVPGLGIPMLALHNNSQSFSPMNWWISEKYDGVRGLWNGPQRTMYSRWGSVLSLPFYILDSFPSFWMDGELWFGREKGMRYAASKTSLKLTQASAITVPWDKFQYMVFDAPEEKLRSLPYSQRYDILRYRFGENPYAHLVQYETCMGKSHAESIFFNVRSKGGEGIILRDPEAAYLRGHSHVLYKYKGFIDAEALVIKKTSSDTFLCQVNMQQLDPENEKEKRIEELELKLDHDHFDGDVGEVGEGLFVSFRYSLVNRKIVNPKIFAVRYEVTDWNQVATQKARKPAEIKLWKPSQSTKKILPSEYRSKFNEFAKKRGFDPLITDHWYNLVRTDYMQNKDIMKIINATGESHSSTLALVYPELTFEVSRFRAMPRNHWANFDNRKKFFDDFAVSKNFDPLQVENWYKIKYRDILEVKGGYDVADYYKGYATALMNIYPFLSWDKTRLNLPLAERQEFWSKEENQRNFFEKFASEMKFNPKVAKNWYSVSDKIKKRKGGTSVIKHFDNSVAKAVMHFYPNIGLQLTHFLEHNKM